MSKEKPSAEKIKEENKDGKPPKAAEHGGPKGLEPTRYGDWERGGKCVDF